MPVTPPREERPRAPWHPVPLVELCVLAGIVLLVLGFLNWETDGGRLMLVCGMLLGSLGGADTALREHFAGYRSHTMVLAGLPAVGLAAVLYFTGVPWPVVVAGALAAFGGAAMLFAREFGRRDGR